jgi:hypothetical protein
MRRGRLLLTVAVFLGVAGFQAWTIWMAPNALSFSLRHVHTDNAVILMMGKHILEKGEFPIFYYGQDWFGSLGRSTSPRCSSSSDSRLCSTGSPATRSARRSPCGRSAGAS